MKRIALAIAALLATAATAHGQAVLKFSHTDTPAGARQKAAEFFAAKVAEYTKGRYTVQVFHSGQLANDPKAVEQLQLGGIDFTVTATGTYAAHQRSLNLAAMPFLVETYEQGWRLYDQSAWLKGEFDKRGIKAIALSVDPLDSHQRWLQDIEETQNVTMNFPVIADPDRKVATLHPAGAGHDRS